MKLITLRTWRQKCYRFLRAAKQVQVVSYWCKHGTRFGPLITTFRHNHGHTSKIEVTYKRPAFSQLFSTSLVFVRLPSPLIPSLSLFPIQDTLYLFYLCHLSVTRFPSGPGSHGSREKLSSISKFANRSSLRIDKMLLSPSRVIDLHLWLLRRVIAALTGFTKPVASWCLMTNDKG